MDARTHLETFPAGLGEILFQILQDSLEHLELRS